MIHDSDHMGISKTGNYIKNGMEIFIKKKNENMLLYITVPIQFK